MEAARYYHTKGSKSERERQIPYDITQNLYNYDTNEPSMKQTHRHRADLWLPKQGGSGVDGWEVGISRGKLLYLGWINNKILLYSTGNYIQYPVINHNEKYYEKEYVCVCVYIYIYI